MMKKLLIATAAVTLAAGTAGAADLPMKAPPVVAPPVTATWTGCYIDGGVGYGMWNNDQYTETLPGLVATSTQTITDGGRGWLGRAGAGCDYQFNSNFVVGVFGDYDWMSLNGSNAFQNNGLTGFGPPTAGSAKESSAWYVGGRIGYLPYPNLMTFISGGYTETTFDQVSLTSTAIGVPPPAGGAFLPQTTFHGWFIGGGYEYRIPWFTFNGLFWKTEYRFAEYQAQDLALFGGAGVTPGFGQNDKPYVQTITSSLVWKFNWGGPVVAKY